MALAGLTSSTRSASLNVHNSGLEYHSPAVTQHEPTNSSQKRSKRKKTDRVFCGSCHQGFSRQDALLRHQRSGTCKARHSHECSEEIPTRSYHCRRCVIRKAFLRRDKYREHLGKHHGLKKDAIDSELKTMDDEYRCGLAQYDVTKGSGLDDVSNLINGTRVLTNPNAIDRLESNVNLDIVNSFPLDNFTWTSGHFTPANSVTPIVNINHDWNPNPVNDPVLAYSSYYSPDDINTHTTTNDAVTTIEPSVATVDPSELLPDSTPGASFNSTDDIPDPAVNTIEPPPGTYYLGKPHPGVIPNNLSPAELGLLLDDADGNFFNEFVNDD